MSKEIVDLCLQNKPEALASLVNTAIVAKINELMHEKNLEIAKNLFTGKKND